MGNFHYFMPTDCYFGRGCVAEHKAAMAKLGKKAMVVTGKTSAKRNGAQQDITDALDSLGIAWILFDEIEDLLVVCHRQHLNFFVGLCRWVFDIPLAIVHPFVLYSELHHHFQDYKDILHRLNA